MKKFKVDISEGPHKGRSFIFEGETPPTDADVQSHLSNIDKAGGPDRVSGLQGELAQMRSMGPSPIPYALSKLGTDVKTAGKKVGAFTLPVAGGLIGGGIGGLAGGVGAPVGAMVGSGLGTAASQALGFEEPSMTQIGISTAAGGIPLLKYVPGMKQAGKFLTKYVPGWAAAKLHNLATAAPEKINQMVATTPSKPLWQAFNQVSGTRLADTPALRALIQTEGPTLETLARTLPGVSKSKSILKGLTESLMSNKNPLTFELLDDHIKGVGRVIRQMEKTDDAALPLYKQIYSALMEDLEKAPLRGTMTKQAASMRAAAVEATKREVMKGKVETSLAEAISPVAGEGDLVTINTKQFLEYLSDVANPAAKRFDKHLVQTLQKELPELTKWAQEINRLPQGSGKVGSLVVQGAFGATGAGIGSAMAGPVGGFVGGMTGVGIPTMLAEIITSPVGREIIKNGLTTNQGFVTAQSLNAAWQAVRAATTQEPGSNEEMQQEVTTGERP